MATIDDKPINSNKGAQKELEKKAQKINADQKKAALKGDSDTEPDEFIGPDADTDLPIDGQVLNDAVLRGEPKADDWPSQDNNNEADTPPKMDTKKK